MKSRASLLVLLLLAASAAPFSDFTVFFTNYDTVGIRTNAVLTAGLPFAKGEMTDPSRIALFNGAGTELAAQFTPLTRFDDGSLNWVLADFLVPSVAQGDTARYTVKNLAPTARPAQSITVDSSSSAYTVNTGAIRFRVNRTGAFTVFDSLWIGGRLLIAGGCLAVDTGTPFVGSTLNDVHFEYLGPVRATLFVSGTFFTAAKGGLTHHLRITAHAGSGELKIESSVRNASNTVAGTFYALKKDGTLRLKCAPGFAPVQKDTTRIQRAQTGYNWYEDASGSGAGLLVASRFGGGYTVDAKYHKITLSSDTLSVSITRFMDLLPDLATRDQVVYLSFYPGSRTPLEQDLKVRSWRYMAYALADPDRIGAVGNFTVGKFGSLWKEMAMLRERGNQWEGAGNAVYTKVLSRYIQINQLPAPLTLKNSLEDWVAVDCPQHYSYGNISTTMNDIHGDVEADQVEARTLMWARTLSPHYLMMAFSSAGYYKTFFPLRTDGFMYDGCYSAKAPVKAAATRTFDAAPTTLKGGRIDELTWSCCHIFGAGLGDWYCLTGDVDAKMTLEDLAEVGYQAVRYYPASDARGFTRPLLLTARAAQITGNPVWRTRTAELSGKVSQISWDPRGFIPSKQSSYLFTNYAKTWHTMTFNGLGLVYTWATVPYVKRDIYDITQPDTPQMIFDIGYGYLKSKRYTEHKSADDSLMVWCPYELSFWQSGEFSSALQTVHDQVPSEDMRDFIIGMADMNRRYAILPCGYGSGEAMFGFPHPDSVSYYEYIIGLPKVYPDGVPVEFGCANNGAFECHKVNCIANQGRTVTPTFDTASGSLRAAVHSGYHPRHRVNALSLGYDWTGDPVFREAAWRQYELGAKRGYIAETLFCGADKAGGFINEGGYNENRPGTQSRLLWSYFQDYGYQPDPVAGVNVAKSGNQYTLTWTTPANAGNGGEVIIKYDSVPIVEYYQFKYSQYVIPRYVRDRTLIPTFSAHTWHMAKNLSGEPAAQAGTLQNFTATLTEGWPAVYFAVRVRGPKGALSPLSVEPGLGMEKGGRVGLVSAAVAPSPFNPAATVTFNVPVPQGSFETVRAGIYDASGRLIRTLVRDRLASGVHRAVWNGRDDRGRAVSSGFYLLKLSVGSKTLTRTLVMSK